MSARFVLRVRVLTGLLVFVAVVCAARLYVLQIMHGSEYARRADAQIVATKSPLLNRGSIYFTDKDGQTVLAATLTATVKT